MRICLINNRYGRHSKGGAETVIMAQVEKFRNDGHEVFVIATKPYNDKITSDTNEDNVFFVPTLYYFFQKMPKPFRFIWHVLDLVNVLSYLRVKDLINDLKPELIVTHNLKGFGYPIVLIAQKLKIDHRHVLHDIQLLHPSGLLIYGYEKILDSVISKIYQTLCRAIFRNVRNVSSPSKWLLELHKKYKFFVNTNNQIEPNPLTFKIEKNLQREYPGASVFLFVGQIEEHKGVELLIRSFLNIPDISSIQLKIIGTGSKLYSLKKSYKDAGNILFTGKLSRREVKESISTSTCLVLPSICYENAPTVLFEAISCGLPVLASRLGGTTEIIHDLGGILFEPTNSIDLQRKMEWVIKNPAKMAELSKRSFTRLSNMNRS